MTANNMPEKIGKYRITGRLGEGAGGVVYKGFDVFHQRVVAVKTLRRPLPREPRAAATFAARLREQAQAIARLSHPGIVALHEIDEFDGHAFIAMEHVAGLDLTRWLAASPLPPVPVVLQVMDQLLEALACAHLAGIRHGDVKPGNVLITANGTVKLTDFGLALAEGRTGAHAGAAPEYQAGRLHDQGVDIYAAGVVLYLMLTGRDPFVDMAAPDHVGTGPRAPSKVGEAQRPAAFDAVVAKAMAREPGQRYESAMAFREALRAASDQRLPVHGAGVVTLAAGSASALAASDVFIGTAPVGVARAPGLFAGQPAPAGRPAPGRPVPVGGAAADVPTLTIAIPDSILTMPAYDPWARPESAGWSESVRGESALLVDSTPSPESERELRAAAAAASASVAAAVDAAGIAAARVAAQPSGLWMSLPRTSGGMIVSESVSAPRAGRVQAGAAAASLPAGAQVDLSPEADGQQIPAEALRRVLRVLTSHLGADAGEMLKRAAGRARTIVELNALLVDLAGEGVDRKKMAKQLKAVARMPL